MRQKLAYSYIAAAAMLWGIIGLFSRQLAAAGLSPMQIVWVRVAVAASVMSLWLLITDHKKLKIQWKDSLWFAGNGICSLVFFNWCYFRAIEVSSLAMAAVLLYTAPIFVQLFSLLLFGESFTIRKTITAGIVFIGCMMVSGIGTGNGTEMSFLGFLYGIGAGIGYALYSILGTILLGKNYESETINVFTFIFAVLGATLLSDINLEMFVSICNVKGIIAAAGIGILCSIIPFTFYTRGLKQIPASKASVLASLEPVIATLSGFLFFHEKLGFIQFGGICMIVGGIILIGNNRK